MFIIDKGVFVVWLDEDVIIVDKVELILVF